MKKKYQEIGTILKNRKQEIESDKKLKIHTNGIKRLDNSGEHYDYVPTPYHMLNLLFTQYPFKKEDILIDVGCGLGRVLVVAVASGCQRAIGIEVNIEIYEKLLENLMTCDYRDNIEVICQNAESAVGIQIIGNKYFFFNPFSIRILQRIIKNIFSVANDFYLFFYAPFKNIQDYLISTGKLQLVGIIENEDDYELSIYVYKSINK